MAVLGYNGVVKAQRTPPEDATLYVADMNLATNSIACSDYNFWSGDKVTLTSSTGVPTEPVEDGVGMFWNSMFTIESNRDHITAESDPFYADDVDDFWFSGSTTTSITLYIYRDILDRVSFYSNRIAALNGDLTERIPLLNLDWDTVTMTYVPVDWNLQASMQEWSLELSASSVDTTGVGEKFGEAVKALVTGGGRFQFLVDRSALSESSDDPTVLMKLLFLFNKEAELDTQFWMIDNRQADACSKLLPGDLYYTAKVLITSVTINTRAEDLIAGTAQFVTTGNIELKMAGSV